MIRRFRPVFVGVFLAGSLSPAVSGESATASVGPRILVGPNILVSRDGDVPHVELMVAASPRTTKNLLGGAITATRPNGGWECRAYASTDGGSSWKASDFPEQVEFGGGDPQVAYTPQGTALFVALTMNKSEKGKDCASMHVWRSEDGGKGWLPSTEIPCSPSWDHEQIVVDQTKGKYAGRIYMGALYDYPVYRVGVFRSEDDGRTWTGPVEAANGGGTIGINDIDLMVLSDGTLVVPYVDFEFLPEKRKSKGTIERNLWFVTSSDGGVTFSSPKKIMAQRVNLDQRDGAGSFALAADNRSTEYRDRLYVVSTDSRHGKPRLLFSRSLDRGQHWSPLALLDAKIPEGARQFQPAVSVNKDGVLAVTWFDSRDSADGKEYHQYFAASVDGGATFLPSVRISSAPSNPKGRGNSQISPDVFIEKDVIALSFLSAASRWGDGGDYMGLAADKDGDFHPFWADARTGTFQIYSTDVKVEVPPKKDETKGTSPASTPPKTSDPASRIESSLVGKVEFVFDPTRYDPDKKEVEVPVRLKNVSAAPIYPPIRVEVLGFGFPEYQSEDDKKTDAENAPSALNATNGKQKEGASFDFGGALGSAEALVPGAQTNPVVMRFRLVDPEKTPNLRLKAVGRVASGS